MLTNTKISVNIVLSSNELDFKNKKHEKSC
nr:MAG TPA: hypothetical protein [Caudoviricetes sp.]